MTTTTIAAPVQAPTPTLRQRIALIDDAALHGATLTGLPAAIFGANHPCAVVRSDEASIRVSWAQVAAVMGTTRQF